MYIILFTIITPCLSQYQNFRAEMKPDVTFGDHNDRFDVSNILRQQKFHYKDEILDPQSGEFRRRSRNKHMVKNPDKTKRSNVDTDTKSLIDILKTGKGSKKLRKKIVRKVEDHVNELANSIILKMRNLRRNFDEDFAYHDKMNSEGGDVEDYNINLKKFEVDSQNLRGDEEEVSSRRLQDIVDKLHDIKLTRRVMPNPEREILLHYGFPVDVKIEGFLKPLPDS